MDNQVLINILIIIIIIIALVLYTKYKNKGIVSITTQDLKELLSNKSRTHVFVDVRTANEYKNRKIKKFKNIPVGQISNRLTQLPKEKTIVLICQSGSRSSSAARILIKAGYTDILNVRGGMNLWR